MKCGIRVYKPCHSKWKDNPATCPRLEESDTSRYHAVYKAFCDVHADQGLEQHMEDRRARELRRRQSKRADMSTPQEEDSTRNVAEELAGRESRQSFPWDISSRQSGRTGYRYQGTTDTEAIAAQGAYAQPQPSDLAQHAGYYSQTFWTDPFATLPAASNTSGVRSGYDLPFGYEFQSEHGLASGYASSFSQEFPSNQSRQDDQRSSQYDIAASHDRDYRESSYEPLGKYIYASTISGSEDNVPPTSDVGHTQSSASSAIRRNTNRLPVPVNTVDEPNQDFVLETLAPRSQASLSQSLQQTAAHRTRYEPRFADEELHTTSDPPPDQRARKKNRGSSKKS